MAARTGFPTERGKVTSRAPVKPSSRHVAIDEMDVEVPAGLVLPVAIPKVPVPTTKVVESPRPRFGKPPEPTVRTGLITPRGTAKSYVVAPRGAAKSIPPAPKAPPFEILTCELANDWMRARRDPRILELLEPQFKRRLEDLERVTRGQASRCFCLKDRQGREHSRECPARKP